MNELWDNSWLWSLPLITTTVMLHVVVLGAINAQVVVALQRIHGHRRYLVLYVTVMGVTTLLATLLHAVEGVIWALAYHELGALPDMKAALIYSLSALTTYGHAELYLARHWQLMGALEALNGLLLFGLTTAFLYGHVRSMWALESDRPRRHAH